MPTALNSCHGRRTEPSIGSNRIGTVDSLACSLAAKATRDSNNRLANCSSENPSIEILLAEGVSEPKSVRIFRGMTSPFWPEFIFTGIALAKRVTSRLPNRPNRVVSITSVTAPFRSTVGSRILFACSNHSSFGCLLRANTCPGVTSVPPSPTVRNETPPRAIVSNESVSNDKPSRKLKSTSIPLLAQNRDLDVTSRS